MLIPKLELGNESTFCRPFGACGFFIIFPGGFTPRYVLSAFQA